MEDILKQIQKMIDEKNAKTEVLEKQTEINNDKSLIQSINSKENVLEKLQKENKELRELVEDLQKKIPIILHGYDNAYNMKIKVLANWYKYFNGEVDYFLTIGSKDNNEVTLIHPENRQVYTFKDSYHFLKNDDSIWIDENLSFPLNNQNDFVKYKTSEFSGITFKRLKELIEKESNGGGENTSESKGTN